MNDDATITPATQVSEIKAREYVDGITLTAEEKATFKALSINFASGSALFKHGKQHIVGLSMRGDAAELLIAGSIIKKLLHDREDKRYPYSISENGTLIVNEGPTSKDLATILCRNGIEFSGMNLLANDGPSSQTV